MASVQEIRQRLRSQRIDALRSRIEPLLAGRAGAEVWLFGSCVTSDRDYSSRRAATQRLSKTAGRHDQDKTTPAAAHLAFMW